METTRRGFLRSVVAAGVAAAAVARAVSAVPVPQGPLGRYVPTPTGFGQPIPQGQRRFIYAQAGSSGWDVGDFVHDAERPLRILGVAVARVDPYHYGFIQVYGPAVAKFRS